MTFCQFPPLSGSGWPTGMCQKLDLRCAQPPTRVSAALASFDDCDYPTGQSGPSKSHQPPSWDGNEQSRPTSQRTVNEKGREGPCEMLAESAFLPEDETVHYVNLAHPGKHKAIIKRTVGRKFCSQTQTFP